VLHAFNDFLFSSSVICVKEGKLLNNENREPGETTRNYVKRVLRLIMNSNIISRLAGQFVTGFVSISDTILLIPQVLYEHGNHGGMISTELLIHPPELSGNPASIYPVANQDELGERNYEFSLRSFLLIFRIYLREKTCCGLLSPLKSIA
jgi:hypothetical protein